MFPAALPPPDPGEENRECLSGEQFQWYGQLLMLSWSLLTSKLVTIFLFLEATCLLD